MHKKILTVSLLAIAVIAVVIAGCTGTPSADPGNPGGNGIANGKIIVGIDEKYPPYTYIDKNGVPGGFDVESMKWIAEDQGLDYEFKTVEWNSMLQALLDKKIDVIYSGMSVTPDRAEKVAFSEVYWVTNEGVAVKHNSPVTMDDVKTGKVIIGVPRASTTADWVKENLVNTGILSSARLELFDDFPSALAALESGRIEAAIYDTPTVIDSIEGKDFDFLGTIETGEKYAVAVRKDDTELLGKINAGLINLKASPRWNELVTEYKLSKR
ncbi:MAG: amino acid ABC transporter substrate-binding protein [Methanomicrobium sp.]|nr:amino acid ABC transporter substrate-binding protein [Methanomicrobium sp.]